LSLFKELQRRNVFRIAIGYLAGAWLLIQILETLFPIFGLPETAVRGVVITLAIGFIPALVLAWVFEWTPEGLKRDSHVSTEAPRSSTKNFDRIVSIILVLALSYFAVDKFLLDPVRDAAREEAVAQKARSEALVESYGDRSIAVLPFVNMSSDPEQEYFADGISEELLNLLAHSPELRVISRSSAFVFKGQDISIPQIAEQLNVSHVLEGSVRRSGDQLRITAQLIEARSDTHLWSQTYDRPMGDIFAIQDDVAGQVVKALHARLLDQPSRNTQVDPQAYALILQARQLVQLADPDDNRRIRQLLDAAKALEPEYPEAIFLEGIIAEDPEEGYALLHRALQLDPDNARFKSLTAAQSLSLREEGVDFQQKRNTAVPLIEEAVAADSLNTFVLFNAARIAADVGKLDVSVKLNEYVAARDPLFVWAQLNLGYAYYMAGRMKDAVAQYRVAENINNEAGAVQWKLGLALVLDGKAEEALQHFEQEQDPIYRLQGQTIAYHALGRTEDSNRSVRELEELSFPDRLDVPPIPEFWPWGLARAHAYLGNADQAFHYLEIANEQGQPMGGLARHPLFTAIHEDPRWEPFLRKIGQHPEQVAATPLDIEIPGSIESPDGV